MMLIALGVEWLVQARFWSGLRRFSPLITLIFVAMFAAAAWPQVKILRAHSVEPLRESVQVTRSVMNPSNPEIDKVITVGFVQATRGYDPTMYFIRPSDPKGKFESLLERSTTEKKPLFVNLAMPEAARQPTAFPEIMKFIDDPNQFELVKRIHGMTGYTTRYVYRYVGGKL